jgi:hypothetical protein
MPTSLTRDSQEGISCPHEGLPKDWDSKTTMNEELMVFNKGMQKIAVDRCNGSNHQQ